MMAKQRLVVVSGRLPCKARNDKRNECQDSVNLAAKFFEILGAESGIFRGREFSSTTLKYNVSS